MYLCLGYERLVVVTLHRWHQYMSLDAVKEEVSGKAVEFLQSSASNTKKVNHPIILVSYTSYVLFTAVANFVTG